MIDERIENHLVATLMGYPKSVHTVRQELGDSWFEMLENPFAYRVGEVIDQLAVEHIPCDFIAVEKVLQKQGAFPAAGFGALRRFTEHPVSVKGRCMEIREAATRRRLQRVAEMIMESTADPEVVLQDAFEHLGVLRGTKIVSRLMSTLVPEFLADYERRRLDKGDILGITTGFKGLDEHIGGMREGKYHILAARPSHGKSALADNIAVAAAESGRPVLILAHEMSAQDHVRRIFALRGNIAYRSLERGTLHSRGVGRMELLAEKLEGLPLRICARTGVDPSQYASQAYAMRYDEGPGLVILDYIQLERLPETRVPRVDELARISAMWLAVAKETGHSILMLSQLSREAAGKEPELSHLRESGALEQDADVVLLLYRPAVDDDTLDPTDAMLRVAKNREGSLGNFDMDFEGAKMRFTEVAPLNNDPPPATDEEEQEMTF